ncbi:universal stress protein YxiE-like [Lolium rigidum]|uniref:universal stress protein YxiE-like n=1 Tax=Lolium rigidum TaxID=89674 RepID=UPI001F5C9950|nr:universal stress protein YxiE-like [Lolium rigidum]
MAETKVAAAAAGPVEEERSKTVVVVGVDDSDHSYSALEWAVRYVATASEATELVVVHAKQGSSSVFTMGGAAVAADVSGYVEEDLRKKADEVVEKARSLCVANSVEGVVEVMDGQPGNVICNAVEKHGADILVVGSQGHGAIRRAFLGSVSDYCAHNANCSVMIVKQPKLKK